MTGRRAQGIIAICWVLSISIGLTPMMGWHKPSNVSSDCPAGLIKCLFEEVVLMEYMVYFNFFGCVLLPLLLMLAIYLCIFMAARHQLKLMEAKASHGGKSRSTLQKEVHAAKSLAIIVGLFAVCWLPLHIINCFTLFCPKCDHAESWIMYMAIILSHTNSVVNPFIYAYRIREFRQTFRRIIRRHLLGCRELLESKSSVASTHNSTTDSVRLKTNSLNQDPFAEHSAGSCDSYHISPVGGGLVVVSQPPLSVVISSCPQVGSCQLQALRHTPAARQPQMQQEHCRADVTEDEPLTVLPDRKCRLTEQPSMS